MRFPALARKSMHPSCRATVGVPHDSGAAPFLKTPLCCRLHIPTLLLVGSYQHTGSRVRSAGLCCSRGGFPCLARRIFLFSGIRIRGTPHSFFFFCIGIAFRSRSLTLSVGRGEQTANALENNLSKLESKLDELLASFEESLEEVAMTKDSGTPDANNAGQSHDSNAKDSEKKTD